MNPTLPSILSPPPLRVADGRDLQWRRLRSYLQRTVLPFSAYYRARWEEADLSAELLQSWDDWLEVPFTEKSDLLPSESHPDRARDFVLIPDQHLLARRPSTILRAAFTGREAARRALEREYRPVFLTSTTGRSTDSVPFLYTQHDLDRLREAGRRIMETGGSRPDHRHLNVFPYAPHLGFWQVHYAGLGFNTFCLGTGGGKVLGTAGNAALLRKIRPDVLIGMPTFVYHLLQVAAEEGIAVPQLRLIVLGGEKVPCGLRRKLRALAAGLGAEDLEILSTYAFTEAKMAWIECPGGRETGYHLYPDMGFVEIIDPGSGLPVDEGEPGEIVFTPLGARGTVVLRYRTGDHIDGGLTWEPCPACGRTVPRLVGNISRISDVHHLQLDKVKGTLVNLGELEHVLDDIEGVGSWQIELRKERDDPFGLDELIVHVEGTGRERRKALEQRIARRIREATELTPNRIEFHSSSKLRSLLGVGRELKEERIADHRPDLPARPVSRSPHEEIATQDSRHY